MEDIHKKEKAQELAEKVKILLQFAATLAPYLEMLEEVYEEANDNAGWAASAAPLLLAVGVDFEEAQMQNTLQAKRANALINLVKVLKETELERIDFKLSKVESDKIAENIKKQLGLR